MPDTLNYMIIGYFLAIVILGSLIVYIVVRQRSLTAEDAELTAMLDETPSAHQS